eukprot:m.252811 g.252811  ORF g.252811 m.252811 type:complete len:474 (-) comp15922_c0_seq4:340-1761(-)
MAAARLRAASASIATARRCNALVTELHGRAAAQAAASDARAERGEALGPLDGLLLTVKDNFCIENVPTSCGSKGLEGFVPPYTATVVQKLEALGMVTVAKTNLDEFGMGTFNLHSAAGPVLHPGAHEGGGARVAGGSSGGAAAAVAAGCGDAALGSDTGGSVRLPAAYCGVVGWKPSYGRSSRYGLAAYASSFDTPGVLSTSVRTAAAVANAMSGPDPADATARLAATDYVPEVGESLDGVTVGIPQEYLVEELSASGRRAWAEAERWVQDRGGRVVAVSLPHTSAALPAYYLLTLAEASSNMARYDGVEYGRRARGADECGTVEEMITAARDGTFGSEVRKRVLTGAFTLSRTLYDSYYAQAQRVRRMVCDDFGRVFGGEPAVDVLITPTACGNAPTLAEAQTMSQLETLANDVFTVPASLAGLPAISIPGGVDDGTGLPLGLQIIGTRGNESSVLRVAQALEEEHAASRAL